jgi:hypothetical protein
MHRNLVAILVAAGATIFSFPNVAAAECRGYSGPGGPCYVGPGGGLYAGPGGGRYEGPGGGLYAGPGGGLYAGPGGGMYEGPGGAASIMGRAAVCTQVQAAEFIRDRPEGQAPTRVLGVRALPA